MATVLAVALGGAGVAEEQLTLTPAEQALAQLVIAAQCRDQLADKELFPLALARVEAMEEDLPEGTDLTASMDPGFGTSADGQVNLFLPMVCEAIRSDLTH